METSFARPLVFSSLGQRAEPPTIARLMTMALENPGLLSLAAGFTDNATLPTALVADAARALASRTGEPEHLQYGTNQGRGGLRRLLAERMATVETGIDAVETQRALFITNGSQQALYLAVQVLCEPGDIVLVDRPSYFVFLEVLKGLGVEARSLPTDPTGHIDGAALDRMLGELHRSGKAARVKAVYFVSYFSNPSARSLEEAEKTEIAVALRRHDLVVPVIEDAAYRELYFTTPHAARSVVTLPAWAPFPKLYTATLTKPFATGLKVGFGLCSDDAWLRKMLHVKGHHDFGTANFSQALLEHALASGGYDAQLRRIRPAYEAKMRALHEALEATGLRSSGWYWSQPAGGLYLWLRAPENLDTSLDSAFCRACLEAGVLYVPGELCFGDEAPRNFARLSFGVLGERDLVEAGRRFGATARRFA
jgi:2-aminoadipate transaminase